MNNGKDTSKKVSSEVDDIGRLIRHVGVREAVPEERLERSRVKVRDHWEQLVREQQTPARRPRFVVLARVAGIAAVAAIALVLTGRSMIPDPQAPRVAIVERVVGEISIDGSAVTTGQEIAVGTLLTTAEDGRVALRLTNGQALRIDHDTQLTIAATDRLVMKSGALYIDTAGAERAGPVEVETTLGTARDIGTQFQVRLTSGTLLVGVRDGMVEVERGDQNLYEVNAGSQARFAAGGQNVTEPLDTNDPDWNWIETVSPAFNMDGASLAEYLRWYSDSTGVELVWANTSSSERAARITLTGNLEDNSPDESLLAVQRIAPFEFRREDRRLWVKVE